MSMVGAFLGSAGKKKSNAKKGGIGSVAHGKSNAMKGGGIGGSARRKAVAQRLRRTARAQGKAVGGTRKRGAGPMSTKRRTAGGVGRSSAPKRYGLAAGGIGGSVTRKRAVG